MMHDTSNLRPARSRPRLFETLLLSSLAVALIAVNRGSGADTVDELRAAYRKNIDKILLLTQELPRQRDKLSKLEKDPEKKNSDDVAKAREAVDKATMELDTDLAERKAALEPILKEELDKGGPFERIAYANIIGDEAQLLRYPSKAMPGLAAKLHPEVPYLVQLTEPGPNNPVEVRQAAALALGKTNGDPKVVVAALAKLLRDQQNPLSLRLAAAEALGRPIQHLLRSQAQAATQPQPGKTAGSEKDDTSRDLRSILMDSSATVWPVLLDGLKDPSPAVRRLCASEARDITGAFLDQAQVAQSHDFYQEYADLLKAFQDDMPQLLLGLDDRDPAVNLPILTVVDDLATARLRVNKNLNPEAPRKPVSRNGQTHTPERTGAILLVDFQAQEKPVADDQDNALPSALKIALPPLLRSMKSPDVNIRRAAGYALEDIASDSPEILHAEAAALNDPDRFVRWTMLRTLGRAAPKEAKVVVPAVIPLLRDEDIDIRLNAAHVIERYGKEAGSAAGEAVARMLANDDTSVQIAAFKALQAIGVLDVPALALVAQQLQNSDASVRVSAAETLGRAGKNSARFLPALEQAMNDTDEKVRTAASEALLRIKN
jgi:HEAT repeat protein